jgi:hypothetical protein
MAACMMGLLLQLMLWTPVANAEPNPLKNAYFGDTHVHTSWSPDAFSQGTRTTPHDAYDYAKGAAIDHMGGYKIQLKQPLDFYMVTDHSEYMGVLPQILEEDSTLRKTEVGKLILANDNEKAFEVIGSSLVGITPPIPEFMQPDVSKSVWQEIVKIADEYNEPGKFTTFPAYEWTSQGPTGTQNLHRNIIFRSSDGVPELPFSSFDSNKPEELWNFMDEMRAKDVGSTDPFMRMFRLDILVLSE